MLQFVTLYFDLDRTESTNEKVALLKTFFSNATSEDGAWALFFLLGNRLKRTVSSSDLARWCKEWKQIPDWLFDECYAAVGDTAETVTLLLSDDLPQTIFPMSLFELVQHQIVPLAGLKEPEKMEKIFEFWKILDRKSCYIFNKLLTGGFRVGASKQLTTRALAEAFSIPIEKLAHALFGFIEPSKAFFERLKKLNEEDVDVHHPMPFFLASPIETLEELGDVREWFAEWKWDGIRAQIVMNDNTAIVWSRGDEIISHQCPEIVEILKHFSSSCILDGEILAFVDGKPLSFFSLQKRLGRKKPTKKIQEEVPLIYMAYDILSFDGVDLRLEPLEKRRQKLHSIVTSLNSPLIQLSPTLDFHSWENLREWQNRSLEFGVEGVMIKSKASAYKSGRVRGEWWKYKIAPMTMDAVLLYAQPGSGRRANLYTDYTFAIWSGENLIPIAKAYSGLTQVEIEELDRWIRKHTVEKFGPVRSVEPFHVFELAFENVQPSSRHKSGLAVRFPRILRWRKDKLAKEADTLEHVMSLLKK